MEIVSVLFYECLNLFGVYDLYMFVDEGVYWVVCLVLFIDGVWKVDDLVFVVFLKIGVNGDGYVDDVSISFKDCVWDLVCELCDSDDFFIVFDIFLGEDCYLWLVIYFFVLVCCSVCGVIGGMILGKYD